MKLRIASSILAAFAVLAGQAEAADLGGSIKDQPDYVPAFTWTGLYVGGHAGWEQKDLEGSDPVLARYGRRVRPDVEVLADVEAPFPAATSQNIDGWLGGIQFGYNHQFGRAVVGTELSGSWGDVSGDSNCSDFPNFRIVNVDGGRTVTDEQKIGCGADQDWTIQWLSKVGIAFGSDNRALAYMIGGVTATEININRSVTSTRTFTDTSEELVYTSSALDVRWSGSQTTIGVVFGAGLQYAFSNSVSLGVEYLHAEYASADVTVNYKIDVESCLDVINCEQSSRGTGRTNVTQQLGADTVRAVLNFKLN